MFIEKLKEIVNSNVFHLFVVISCLYSVFASISRIDLNKSDWLIIINIISAMSFLYLAWFNSRIIFERNFPKSLRIITFSNLLKITDFLYSNKTQRETFLPIVADWQHELGFEQLFNKRKWKVRWINVLYIYAFLGAIWQKSPLGDLIEFIRKIAK